MAGAPAVSDRKRTHFISLVWVGFLSASQLHGNLHVAPVTALITWGQASQVRSLQYASWVWLRSCFLRSALAFSALCLYTR